MRPERSRTRQVVIHGDGVAALEELPAGAVAAVVTDPPWNLGKDYGGDIDDARADAAYAAWLHRVLAGALRAARETVILLPGSSNLQIVGSLLARLDVPWQRTMWWEPPPESVRPPETTDVRREPILWLRHAPPGDVALTEPFRVPLEIDPYLRHHPCPSRWPCSASC